MSRTPSAAQLISLMCFAQVFSMSGTLIFPALLPTFVNIWGLTNTDAGWINGIYFAGYLIAVPVLVSLTDRTSPRKIYLFCLGLGALSSLGFATVTDGFWAAILFRTLGGVGLAEPMFFGVTLNLASPVGAAGGATIESWGWTFALSGTTVALGPVFLAMLMRGVEH